MTAPPLRLVAAAIAAALAAGTSSSAPLAAWGTTLSAPAGVSAQALGVAIAPGDARVLAVGGMNPGRAPSQQLTDPYAEVWEGSTKSWTATPVPLGSVYDAQQALLWGVYAPAADLAVAVGYVEDVNALRSQTLLYTFNGAAWTRVPSLVNSSLHAVAGCSASDIWAVGATGIIPSASRVAHSTDGAGAVWTEVAAVPDIGTLTDVVCDPVNNAVWVASSRTVMKLDRSSGGWTTLPPLPVAAGSVYVAALAWAPSANGLWAVGGNVVQAGEGQNRFPYAALYNSSGKWTVETVSGVSGAVGVEYAAVAATSTTVWAALGEGGVVNLRPAGASTIEVTPGTNAVSQLSSIAVTEAGHPWAVGTIYGSPWRPALINSPGIGQGGIVVSTGVSGAGITWNGPATGSGTARVDGSFAIGGLPEGDYEIVAAYNSCTPGRANATVASGVATPVSIAIKC